MISVRYSSVNDPIICIAIPKSCGILEGISDQSRGNCLELPPNWYKSKDLLGFAIFYADVGSEFVGCSCYLTIKGNGKQKHFGPFSLLPEPFLNSGRSDFMCIMCYTKAVIAGNYYSNQWTHLVPSLVSDATADGVNEACVGSRRMALFDNDTRVEGCSIHLIWAKDYVQMHPSMVQASSSRWNSSINGIRQFFSRGTR